MIRILLGLVESKSTGDSFRLSGIMMSIAVECEQALGQFNRPSGVGKVWSLPPG